MQTRQVAEISLLLWLVRLTVLQLGIQHKVGIKEHITLFIIEGDNIPGGMQTIGDAESTMSLMVNQFSSEQ